MTVRGKNNNKSFACKDTFVECFSYGAYWQIVRTSQEGIKSTLRRNYELDQAIREA